MVKGNASGPRGVQCVVFCSSPTISGLSLLLAFPINRVSVKLAKEKTSTQLGHKGRDAPDQ